MARILVTGANGHLGRRLIRTLAPDHRIEALVRRAAARDTVTRDIGEHANVNVTVADPSDPDAVAAVAESCDTAVHLIGTIKATHENPYSSSHERPINALIEAASRTGVARIIYISILGADPSSDCRCLRHRATVESLLEAADPRTITIRVPMVLGERDRASRALARRAAARRVVLFRGASLEQPIYAGDVIAAINNAMSSDVAADEVHELAGPESLPRRELVRRAARLLGRQPTILSLPFAFGLLLAGIGEVVSKSPPVTRDMLRILDHDDHIDPSAAAAALDLELTSLDEMLRRCLVDGRQPSI